MEGGGIGALLLLFVKGLRKIIVFPMRHELNF
jgi:hypothetical protein